MLRYRPYQKNARVGRGLFLIARIKSLCTFQTLSSHIAFYVFGPRERGQNSSPSKGSLQDGAIMVVVRKAQTSKQMGKDKSDTQASHCLHPFAIDLALQVYVGDQILHQCSKVCILLCHICVNSSSLQPSSRWNLPRLYSWHYSSSPRIGAAISRVAWLLSWQTTLRHAIPLMYKGIARYQSC